MQATLTFFRLVALTMAILSLFPFIFGVRMFFDILPPDASWLVSEPFLSVVNWHDGIYWSAAHTLGILPGDITSDFVALFLMTVHGTNLLLGTLSLRAILRASNKGAVNAIGSAVTHALPYVQQAALWMLNAITAGVLGNYAWMLLSGKM